ncbi:hypothetical protein FOTG_15187 [Fusarium oxysporum f. sp. vasinfectum 25433]|uniref:Zn(2)-C6 fungal-type domain-containing protein n=1 Tax=Fusarium oxysporum f. sp. vasinfectum 25433 TaxID=1089449 RepID=X0M7B4_FUSOX|nr:hypothetical protein FOTG_15187 [Fusarium oxysporum f. sp. vasinfectum 25433]
MSPDAASNLSRKKAARASPDTCAACRARKVRCDGRRSTGSIRNAAAPVRCNEEQPGCRRCTRPGIVCVYPLPGPASHSPLSRLTTTTALSPATLSDSQSTRVRRGPPREPSVTVQAQPSQGVARVMSTGLPSPKPQELETEADNSDSPTQEASTDDPVDATSYEPSEEVVIKALTTFFTSIRHVPIFSFLHRALVMDQYQNKNINKALLFSIIGVVSVYHNLGPGMVDRGNELISRAETLVLRDLEKPTVPHVQALIFIVKHRAYRRRFTSSFALTAIAIRFAMGLRMNYDDPKLDFLTQECCRRTMWSLYLIDSVMSAGYRDFALASSQLLHIQLPTHDSNFDFDVPEQGDYLGSTHHGPEGKAPSILGLVIQIMHIRYNVLDFTKKAVTSYVDMSEFGPQVDAFQLEFNNYQSRLPTQFQVSTRNIQLHAHSPSLSSFLSIQVNWHMAQCNLYRLTMEGLVEALPQHALAALDLEFLGACRARCYESAKSLADILCTVLSVRPHCIALDLDIAVSIYQCLRILAHANSTLKIVPDDKAEAVQTHYQTCIDFLESMFFESEATIAIVRSIPCFFQMASTD